MIRVHGFTVSPFVTRVRSLLIFKGIKHELVPVDMQSKYFNDLTPVAKVPVVEDGELVIWDSNNIALYIEEKFAQTYKMVPEDPEKRARLFNIVALNDKMIHDGLFFMAMEQFSINDRFREAGFSFRARVLNEDEKVELKEDFSNRFSRLSEMLGDNEFFVGDQYSYADAAVLGTIRLAQMLEFDTSSMNAWYGRHMQNPQIAQMFED